MQFLPVSWFRPSLLPMNTARKTFLASFPPNPVNFRFQGGYLPFHSVNLRAIQLSLPPVRLLVRKLALSDFLRRPSINSKSSLSGAKRSRKSRALRLVFSWILKVAFKRLLYPGNSIMTFYSCWNILQPWRYAQLHASQILHHPKAYETDSYILSDELQSAVETLRP